MKNIVKGKVVCKFGDNFNADLIVPAVNQQIREPEVLAKVRLVDYGPDFPQNVVNPGDIVIGGQNFGYGHPHPIGIEEFQKLGMGAIIAESFAPVWYRCCISAAFPALYCPGITCKADVGHQLEVNFKTGEIKNLTTGETINARPLHPILWDIINAGGMRAYSKKRVEASSGLKSKERVVYCPRRGLTRP